MHRTVQLTKMSPSESTAMRKRRELMALNETSDEDAVVKSPFLNDPVTNPCIKEQNKSMKCILDNLSNKDLMCKDAFENYRLCQKFWNMVKMDRYWKGIQPRLPLPEERENIKLEYKDEWIKLTEKMKH